MAGRRHLIFEEGTQSAWLYDTLARHVDEIVVTGVLRGRGPKDDRRDAYGLAEKLRIGAADQPVFKAPTEFRALRELARVHGMLVRDVVRVQARIKFVYRSRAVPETAPGLGPIRVARLIPVVVTPHRFRT